jgi:hypothetical protein
MCIGRHPKKRGGIFAPGSAGASRPSGPASLITVRNYFENGGDLRSRLHSQVRKGGLPPLFYSFTIRFAAT